MAQWTQTMLYGDDVEATASLLGHREVSKEAQAAVGKSAFLSEFDRYAPAKGSDSERDVDRFRREQAAATAKLTDIDPDAAFERGHADAMRRVQSAAAEHPFGPEFDAELAKLDTPSHSTVEARRERALEKSASTRSGSGRLGRSRR